MTTYDFSQVKTLRSKMTECGFVAGQDYALKNEHGQDFSTKMSESTGGYPAMTTYGFVEGVDYVHKNKKIERPAPLLPAVKTDHHYHLRLFAGRDFSAKMSECGFVAGQDFNQKNLIGQDRPGLYAHSGEKCRRLSCTSPFLARQSRQARTRPRNPQPHSHPGKEPPP